MSLARQSSGVAAATLAILCFGPGDAHAALVERCSWPPPGGPSAFPDSVQVEVPPLVGDLDADGIPEIVILTFVDGVDDNGGQDGILRVLDGATCAEELVLADPGCVSCFGDTACRSLEVVGDDGTFCAACTPAIADLDGDGDLEIVALGERDDTAMASRRLVVVDHEGGLVSCSAVGSQSVGNVAAVALADLDGDGVVEALARDVAWSVTGELLWESRRSGIGATTAVDLDDDGDMEVFTGQAAYSHEGDDLWRRTEYRGGSPAIADLNLDCRPDLIIVSRNRQTINVADPLTGDVRASAPMPSGDCPFRADGQGGPPVVADIDGDCVPEIGVAGCRRYAFFRYDAGPPETLELAWESPVDDGSSRFTSSSIYDLDGDGTAEVLYNDHEMLRIYDAVTGAVEQAIPNTSSTLLEFPVVADADGDGRADVLVAANDYAGCCNHGVRVFVDDSGAAGGPVRPLFNQHSYHVTNVLDDGRIPLVEEPGWERFNSFRVQTAALREPGGPTITGVLDDVTVRCGQVPPPSEPSATGGCGDEPTIVLRETSGAIDCPGVEEIVREWIATDRCGEATIERRVITVVDERAPELEAPPEDLVLRCDEPVPPPVTLAASDACDASPDVHFEEAVVPGPCPSQRTIVREWTARDDCGHETAARRTIEIVDDGPPRLVGVPADAVVDCDEVPPPPVVEAEDGCSDPDVRFDEQRIDGDCPSRYRLIRRWEAVDDCDNRTVAQQVIEVRDEDPPRLVSAPERSCLWPPNHWMVCFDPSDLAPVFVDDCDGEVTWSVVACESDQPANDVGDGDFLPDCRLEPDGRICVRSERQGTDPEGRHYGLLAVAVDACGNASDPALIGDVYVPHDQAPREDCLKTTVVGTRDRGDRDRSPGNSGK